MKMAFITICRAVDDPISIDSETAFLVCRVVAAIAPDAVAEAAVKFGGKRRQRFIFQQEKLDILIVLLNCIYKL